MSWCDRAKAKAFGFRHFAHVLARTFVPVHKLCACLPVCTRLPIPQHQHEHPRCRLQETPKPNAETLLLFFSIFSFTSSLSSCNCSLPPPPPLFPSLLLPRQVTKANECSCLLKPTHTAHARGLPRLLPPLRNLDTSWLAWTCVLLCCYIRSTGAQEHSSTRTKAT